ncbi:predicted protein [Chaetomium globosum CBS 148.51]|uniref:Uncharacterized protein n=1 Tax=Chaetomium globosum (strain ATCC 6205 / CBS 148.51 / DSM 1962 / NBRC 6347 / NRRL 1970) TaxID=306901 RepID=Q2HAJ2_CHAGB|nr:uncharacterized protein CHGG_02762 [Chaetomium globosum CBS 148.51]EAQ90827.1 predicted protein [Chaetomium globosum CBS 148.51]
MEHWIKLRAGGGCGFDDANTCTSRCSSSLLPQRKHTALVKIIYLPKARHNIRRSSGRFWLSAYCIKTSSIPGVQVDAVQIIGVSGSWSLAHPSGGQIRDAEKHTSGERLTKGSSADVIGPFAPAPLPGPGREIRHSAHLSKKAIAVGTFDGSRQNLTMTSVIARVAGLLTVSTKKGGAYQSSRSRKRRVWLAVPATGRR